MNQDSGQGYPGQPSAGTMAPPPPPPPGTCVTQPAPAPAPKKKRTGLVVAIVLVVVLCGLAGCAAAILAFSSGSGKTESISQAEAHYSAMMSAVETAGVALGGLDFDESDVEATKDAVDETAKSLRVGRDEIAAARVAIEQLEDSQGKADYLASLDAATHSLDGLEELVAYLGTGVRMLEEMSSAAGAAKSANDLLNDAISAGNSNKYDTMRAKAKSASSKYAAAAKAFDAAHEIDASAGLDKAAKYARKRKQVADVVVKMAADGKGKRVSAYNKGIAQMNKLNAAAEKIGEPDIVKDEKWVSKRLADLDQRVTADGEMADQLHVKALKGLGYTE